MLRRYRLIAGAQGALKVVAKITDPFQIDTVAIAFAALALPQEPRPAQVLQVLRNRGLGQGQRIHNAAAGGFAPMLQELDDRDACRVGQRSGKVRQVAFFAAEISCLWSRHD